MRTFIAGLVLLAASTTAGAADEVGGFATGGLSSGKLHQEDDPYTYEQETESGGGINVTGALRFKPGVMVRVGYDTITADGYHVCTGGSCTFFTNNVRQEETRAGVFYAPPVHKVFGWRAGGGYERIVYKTEGVPGHSTIDGGFIEGAVLINAGKVVTFDISGAFMAMRDDFDQDVAGAEFSLGAIFHAGPVDIGVTGRGVGLVTDVSGSSSEIDDSFGEGRITVGGQWGYAAR